MTHKIYKYNIEIDDTFELLLPKGAKILSIQVQRNKQKIWALVDTDNKLEKRKFVMYGTGYTIKENTNNLNHIGTFQMHMGELILHVFEIITPSDIRRKINEMQEKRSKINTL